MISIKNPDNKFQCQWKISTMWNAVFLSIVIVTVTKIDLTNKRYSLSVLIIGFNLSKLGPQQKCKQRKFAGFFEKKNCLCVLFWWCGTKATQGKKLTKFRFQHFPFRNLLPMLEGEEVLQPDFEFVFGLKRDAKTVSLCIQPDHMFVFRVRFPVDIETSFQGDDTSRDLFRLEFFFRVVVLQSG